MRALLAPDLLSEDYTGPSQWRGAVIRQTPTDRISARAACAAYSKAAGLVVVREEHQPVTLRELGRRAPGYLLVIFLLGGFLFSCWLVVAILADVVRAVMP